MQQYIDESNQRKEKMNQLWNGIAPPVESESSEEVIEPKYHPALGKRPLFRDQFVDETLFPGTILPSTTKAKIDPTKLPSIQFSKSSIDQLENSNFNRVREIMKIKIRREDELKARRKSK